MMKGTSDSNKNETGLNKSYVAVAAIVIARIDALEKKVDRLAELLESNNEILDLLDTKVHDLLEDLGDDDYLDEIDGTVCLDLGDDYDIDDLDIDLTDDKWIDDHLWEKCKDCYYHDNCNNECDEDGNHHIFCCRITAEGIDKTKGTCKGCDKPKKCDLDCDKETHDGHCCKDEKEKTEDDTFF